MLRQGFLAGLTIATPANPNGGDNLPTPDPITPSVMFERHGAHEGAPLIVPSSTGGTWAEVPTWAFEDGNGLKTWPSPAIRVREGQAVHTHLGTGMGPHTIHHHGIEPTPMNDGVGHLTFEVSGGNYAYQWIAAEAGTYFYHCHRNTVLHFERGMYGGLIIDPPEGPGTTYVGNAKVQYQAEALWVVDDIDTRWHELDRDAANNDINYGTGPTRPGSPPALRQIVSNVASGLQGLGPGKFNPADPNNNTGNNPFTLIVDDANPRLHDFDPNVFVVTGTAVPVNPVSRTEVGGPPFSPSIPRTIDNHRLVARGVTVAAGGKILVRTLNAAYCHTRWSFPTEISGQVIAADGRTFGKAPWAQGYSSPMSLASIGHQFQLSVARRWDVLLDTAGVAPGVYDAFVSVFASVGNGRQVTIRLPITVQ
jgi:FtsP/CotA-like multicopper oxidase with cupredoxin domain